MVKTYGRNVYEDQRRYSPARIIGSERIPVLGTVEAAISSAKIARGKTSQLSRQFASTFAARAFAKIHPVRPTIAPHSGHLNGGL